MEGGGGGEWWVSPPGDPKVQRGCKSLNWRVRQASEMQPGRRLHFLRPIGDNLESHHFLDGTRVKAVICPGAAQVD